MFSMHAIFAILIWILGTIIFAISSTPKPTEIGKWMMILGLAASLLFFGGNHISIVGK